MFNVFNDLTYLPTAIVFLILPLKPFCLFLFVFMFMTPELPEASYLDEGFGISSIRSRLAAGIDCK